MKVGTHTRQSCQNYEARLLSGFKYEIRAASPSMSLKIRYPLSYTRQPPYLK